MTEHEHTKCQSLLVYLSEYVDGDLSRDLCDEIENHLAECRDCHVVMVTLRKTISLYHAAAAGQADVPGIVRERLFHTLDLDTYLRD
jgi:anti-sigma factor RsiW